MQTSPSSFHCPTVSHSLLASCLMYPGPHPKLPSFCLCASLSLPLSILQFSPEGVRKLMALSWVLAINQGPISQAHVKLWTNGYTGMRGPVRTRVYRWRDRTEYRGKLQSRTGTRWVCSVKVNSYRLLLDVMSVAPVCNICSRKFYRFLGFQVKTSLHDSLIEQPKKSITEHI